MIQNMDEFYDCMNVVIKKLIDYTRIADAEKLQNALRISNSSLEILGAVRKEIKALETKKTIRELGCDKQVLLIKEYIKIYWPGY